MKNLDKWKAFLKEQLDYTPDDLINKCPNGICPEVLEGLIVKYNHHPRRNPYINNKWERDLYNSLKRGIEKETYSSKMPSRRRKKGNPKFIVLHITESSSTSGTARSFLRKKRKGGRASSHYEVSPDGVILEYIDPDLFAGHAGRANEQSIGIDMTGFEDAPRPSAQIQGVKKLISYLSNRYGIPQELRKSWSDYLWG